VRCNGVVGVSFAGRLAGVDTGGRKTCSRLSCVERDGSGYNSVRLLQSLLHGGAAKTQIMSTSRYRSARVLVLYCLFGI
jgi:hypothetical protein